MTRKVYSTSVLLSIIVAGTATLSNAATIMVTNSLHTGAGSLRQAIVDANATPASDIINFAPGVTVIFLATDLPTITAPVTIDGSVNATTVIVDGDSNATIGLDVSADDVRLYGLTVANCDIGINVSSSASGTFIGSSTRPVVSRNHLSEGIYVAGPDTVIDSSALYDNGGIGIAVQSTATDVVIRDCDINVNGTAGIRINGADARIEGTSVYANNGDGIATYSGGTGAEIIDCVIHGNVEDGISLGAINAIVQGNLIGVLADGLTAAGNTGAGISILSGGSNALIGGSGVGEGNTISGNTSFGLVVSAPMTLYGNNIGVNSLGTATVGNTLSGMLIQTGATGSRIGGPNSGERNIVSGNSQAGIVVTTTDITIQGNYIGTDTTGQVDLGNSTSGISASLSANNLTIGGSGTGEGNLISGNGQYGIHVRAGTSTIDGNIIGLNIDGDTDLGNNLSGVRIDSTADTATIGSATAGNVLSGNGTHGIDAYATIIAYGNMVGLSADGTTAIPNNTAGIVLQAGTDNSIIGGGNPGEGNVTSGHSYAGIELKSASVQIKGNKIGTNAAGTAVMPNTGAGGIYVRDNASDCQIGGPGSEGNLISGNTNGIAINGGQDIAVLGNTIGLLADGVTPAGNATGISYNNGGTGIVGSATAGNTVAWNSSRGLYVSFPSAHIENNTFHNNGNDGLYLASTAEDALVINNVFHSNGSQGIETVADRTRIEGCESYDNTLDGISIGSGADDSELIDSVLHGNGEEGVEVRAANVVIEGCIIGLLADGDTPSSNTLRGINVISAANTRIGGPNPSQRNILSGNGNAGIVSSGSGTLIQGNYIGTDVTGQLDRGNLTNGIYISPSATGLVVGGANPGEGNLISGNTGMGIITYSSGVTIDGNLIGLNVDGDSALPNSVSGVHLSADATAATIGTAAGGNVLSGNGRHGIDAYSPVEVYGNLIGLSSDGSTGIPNASAGIILRSAANDSIIGGPNPGERNVISGHSYAGMQIQSENVQVKGNYIGTDATGMVAIPNVYFGGIYVHPDASTGQIGGPGAEGNLLSGNDNGIVLQSVGSYEVYGNLIGTDATGLAQLGNQAVGVYVYTNSSGGTIGGPGALGNVISGNSIGIYSINSSTSSVFGNKIGTDITGAAPVPNTSSGIQLASSSSATIGSTDSGMGNIIANNVAMGVRITSSAGIGTTVEGNSIHSNGAAGIGINSFGSYPNDGLLDADAGPNNYQNFPVPDPILPGDPIITGVLESTAFTTFTLVAYSNTECNPTGYGSGRSMAGMTTAITDATGSVSFSLPLDANAVDGEFYSLTATHPVDGTSPFSKCIMVEADPNPDAVAITRAPGQANPTSDPSVVFEIEFDELVSGALPSNFQVTESGTAGSAVGGMLYKFGNAATIGGVAGSLNSEATLGPDLANQSYTIEFWARRAAQSSSLPVYLGTDSPSNGLYMGWNSNDQPIVDITDSRLTPLPGYPQIGDWNHWAATYNTSTGDRKLYRNAVLLREDTGVADFVGPATLAIGDNPIAAYSGDLDELRFWNVERTQPEIEGNYLTPLTGTESGLVALYQFEEFEDLGVGSDGADDVLDITGNGHDLDASSTPTLTLSQVWSNTAEITVNTGTGTGDIGLEFINPGNVTDRDANAPASGFTGSELFNFFDLSNVEDWKKLDD